MVSSIAWRSKKATERWKVRPELSPGPGARAGIAHRMHNFRGMESLDLSKQPPRSPHAELDGVIFLPRSIDKARAYLDGGNRNGYNVPGVTGGVLERFRISNRDLIAAVG